MVLNSGKCHFMCVRRNKENETLFYNNTDMKSSSEEKILLTKNFSSRVI